MSYIHLYQNLCSCVTRMVSVGPSSVFKIVKMIMERNFQPVIIFSFSKKECEAYALQVAKLDFNRGMCVCNASVGICSIGIYSCGTLVGFKGSCQTCEPVD